MENLIDQTRMNKLAQQAPKCMLEKFENEKLSPIAAPLNDEQGAAAVSELTNHAFVQFEFPKIQRKRVDPPIAQQNYFIFSFTPSSGATPDKDGCFGVMKMRGAFATQKESEEHSEYLIRTVDSFHENLIGFVGRDFPVTLENKYCKETKDVDVRMKLENVSREHLKQQREQEQREMEEIQERQKQLLAETSEKSEVTYEDLDFYVSLRVKLAQARLMQEESDKNVKKCGKVIKQTKEQIYELDEKYPEYQKEYQEKYTNALEAIGGDTQNNKMIEYMK